MPFEVGIVLDLYVPKWNSHTFYEIRPYSDGHEGFTYHASIMYSFSENVQAVGRVEPADVYTPNYENM